MYFLAVTNDRVNCFCLGFLAFASSLRKLSLRSLLSYWESLGSFRSLRFPELSLRFCSFRKLLLAFQLSVSSELTEA